MRRILVTGAQGFIGTHLCTALRRKGGFELVEITRQNGLPTTIGSVDLVFHLAGVNRPQDEREFMVGNAELTRNLCQALAAQAKPPPLCLSSSIQAENDNPYGASKRAGENAVLEYHWATGAPVYIFRLPNVFGKWSRPNYNTVIATFCHHIQRGLGVQLSNREHGLRLVYIDDVVRGFCELAEAEVYEQPDNTPAIAPVYTITLGALHDLLVSFREARQMCLTPDLSDPLTKYLHATYSSFADPRQLATPVALRTDARGWLFELLKSPHGGQIFVSSTRPGVTRGNHYHDTKVEKFCVIQGEGVIRFRSVHGDDLVSYPVSQSEIRVVDIPPGYTHSIENTGGTDMITLFWSSEMFEPGRPDTYAEPVLR